ncbi:hypothetical protein B9Z55_025974 [Caenorhabditis nigoni]|uniref:Uncharacterized protein n=1 Tax=Caenorhabditis nigoni TaxID=1611254 RepID=A0A2G5T1I3_9PELO|nr:hypothetical protein B9Z55_025974 [Caenorhabditis nigoni]
MGYRSWVLPPKLPFEIRRVVPPNVSRLGLSHEEVFKMKLKVLDHIYHETKFNNIVFVVKDRDQEKEIEKLIRRYIKVRWYASRRCWEADTKVPIVITYDHVKRIVKRTSRIQYVIFDLPEDPTQLQKNLIWPLYVSVQRKKERRIKVLITGNERVEDLEPLIKEMEKHEVDTPQWLLDELKMIDESLYYMSVRKHRPSAFIDYDNDVTWRKDGTCVFHFQVCFGPDDYDNDDDDYVRRPVKKTGLSATYPPGYLD